MEGIPVNQYSWRDTKQVYEHIYWDIQIGLTKCSFFPRIKKTTMAQTANNMYLKIVMNSSKQTND